MDEWRHFPSYQLERRADIFSSLYLAEVLEAKLGVPMCPQLAPEFPVRKGTIYPNVQSDASLKIDYLALTADGAGSVFVELKTDGASRRLIQDEYLLAAQRVGLSALLEGVCQIFRATNAKRKYFALMLHLEHMDLLQIPAALKVVMAGKSLRGAPAASNDIVVTGPSATPRIVYVQPNGDGPDVISFDEFADVVARHPDPVSQRFAASLREWSRVQAGGQDRTGMSTQRTGAVDGSRLTMRSVGSGR
jgi:hypothetical protein